MGDDGDLRLSRLSRVSRAMSEGGTPARASLTHSKSKARNFPSVDALLGQIGLGCFTALIVTALSLAQMAQSLNTNLLSYLMPCAGAALHVESNAYGLLGTAFNTASYFSTPLFGAIADSRGRRPAVVLSVLTMAVAGSGAATSQSWLALCLWMALMGVGLGGTMVPFDLLSELAPPDRRGAILNLTNWFWCGGTVLVLFAAWFTVGSWVPGLLPAAWERWRVLVLTVVTPVLLSLLLTPLLVESPHWLVEQGRYDEAMSVLERLARLNGRPPLRADAGLRDSLLSVRPSALTDDGAAASASAVLPSQGGAPAHASHERASHADGAAEGPVTRAARLCLRPLGLGGALDILVEPGLRRRAVVHWLLWLVAGFGWAGLVYFQTFILGSTDVSADGTNASAVPACDFDYVAQLPVLASELPGTLLVQLVVDAPRGPAGLLGGRRGVQIVAFMVCAGAGAVMALGVGIIGTAGVTVFGVVSRFALAAGNSAMWIAAVEDGALKPTTTVASSLVRLRCAHRSDGADRLGGRFPPWQPEMYPTRVRGLGANTAFLFNVLGCIPASNWVYSGLPSWLIGAVIAVANLVVAVLAGFLPETAGIGFDEHP